jgi:hypothetical protein
VDDIVRHAVDGFGLRQLAEGEGALGAVPEVLGQRDRRAYLLQVCQRGRRRLPVCVRPHDEQIASQQWFLLVVHQTEGLGEERHRDFRPPSPQARDISPPEQLNPVVSRSSNRRRHRLPERTRAAKLRRLLGRRPQPCGLIGGGDRPAVGLVDVAGLLVVDRQVRRERLRLVGRQRFQHADVVGMELDRLAGRQTVVQEFGQQRMPEPPTVACGSHHASVLGFGQARGDHAGVQTVDRGDVGQYGGCGWAAAYGEDSGDQAGLVGQAVPGGE